MAARKGSAHHGAKLTEEQVREIRRRYAEGGISYVKLSEEYDIPHSNIGYIVNRQTWKHVK